MLSTYTIKIDILLVEECLTNRVKTMLSTYTIKIDILLVEECLTNSIESVWHWVYPYPFNTLEIQSNQARGNCFKPYKDFLSLQTLLAIARLESRRDVHVYFFHKIAIEEWVFDI